MKEVNYKRIFEDIIEDNIVSYTSNEVNNLQMIIYKKKNSSIFEILEINNKIFRNNPSPNNRLKSYRIDDIEKVLKFRKESGLSIRKVSKIFNIASSTISRWEKIINTLKK